MKTKIRYTHLYFYVIHIKSKPITVPNGVQTFSTYIRFIEFRTKPYFAKCICRFRRPVHLIKSKRKKSDFNIAHYEHE